MSALRKSWFIQYLFVLLLWLVAACSPAAAPDRTILVVGDSLSAGFGVPLEQGWVALLRERLADEGYGYRVVNASISGDTTSGGLRRLPRALEQHRPAIVIIELGGNDGLRGTPVMVIRSNLKQMIDISRAQDAQIVLAGMQMPPNYGASYTEAFADVYADLAADYDAALIPFFMDGVALNADLMQPDGIHPNAAGQPVLLENAWAALEPLL
ncbi:MAG: arylesterase [Gammaproteobacteria bacterium]|nr:arylesterase [Gammaproteobacteria bacterium]